ncbi:MAG: LytTR family DNA-binding domain-containing protein [Oscillospiraceae bacterium]
MINICLCDDNSILLEKYKNMLLCVAEENNILVSLKTFLSGEQLLFYLSDSPNDADIIYLDVIMADLNGIETGKRLRELGCKAEIIFLTSCESHVYDSFDINPLYYMLKDNSSTDKFNEVFLRAVGLSSDKTTEAFMCESGSVIKKIPLKDITYFEIHNRIITVHYNKNTFDFYSTIESVEQELCAKRFIRCHRAFLVNIKHIDSIDSANIYLSDKSTLPVGSTYLKAVKQALSDYLTDMF